MYMLKKVEGIKLQQITIKHGINDAVLKFILRQVVSQIIHLAHSTIKIKARCVYK